MPKHFNAMSPLDYHILLALTAGDLHGYAICQAVEAESGGGVSPRAGSLYRVIARLMRWGLVEGRDRPRDTDAHPGITRKYYGLTELGTRVMRHEVTRLQRTTALAAQRLGLTEGQGS